jgi:hypothetical protein
MDEILKSLEESGSLDDMMRSLEESGSMDDLLDGAPAAPARAPDLDGLFDQ